jgi:hypothetical protein
MLAINSARLHMIYSRALLLFNWQYTDLIDGDFAPDWEVGRIAVSRLRPIIDGNSLPIPLKFTEYYAGRFDLINTC